MATETIPARTEVPANETWNAELVFATRDSWRKERTAVQQSLADLAEFSGKITQDPHTLIQYIDVMQKASRRLEKLLFYAFMASAVDSGDSEAIAMFGQAQSVAAEFSAKTAFAEPEILGMDESVLKGWIDGHETLGNYRHYFEDLLRMKSHVRSAEVEEVLGLVSDPFGTVEQTYELLSSSDMKIADAAGSEGSTRNVTQSNIEAIKNHPDREVRKNGMNNYADAYLSLRNTYATNYIAAAKQAHTVAGIRNHDSVLEYKLSPHNLPVEVFHALIDTFKSHLPSWHRYWDVKAKILGVDHMRPYDIWAPLTTKSFSFTYPEAVEMITTGMGPLGNGYTDAIKKGCLEERWVDYAQNQGKRQGAFSYGTYDTHPCILTSFDGSLSEVSTLAHELGHSMHSFLTNHTQPYLYSEYSMFVAEVASNFNQAMVREHLFAMRDDRDWQLAVIQEAMDNIHRYFFIMPTLARFEYAVYEKLSTGEPLNADVLQELMRDLYAEGYGKTLVDDPERTSITWATFGHLYEPFYTFQYATGISAAHALCHRVLDGGADDVASYLEFLSLGSSVYPLDALRVAGVDMRTAEPIEAGFAALDALVDRLEGLIE